MYLILRLSYTNCSVTRWPKPEKRNPFFCPMIHVCFRQIVCCEGSESQISLKRRILWWLSHRLTGDRSPTSRHEQLPD